MSTYQDLAPDPTTVEIYKGIDCCDEIQTELQSIIQDIASLQNQCDSLRNLMTLQHNNIGQKITAGHSVIVNKLQLIEQRVNATLSRVRRLQDDFAQHVQNFNAWMNWIATALNQMNRCTCGANSPLPPPPIKTG